jgi:hypothetical protein
MADCEGLRLAQADRTLRQVKLRGLEKVDWLFVFSCAAHNLIRLPRLKAQPREIPRAQLCLYGGCRPQGRFPDVRNPL